MQDFKRIDAWKKAHALALNVRRAVQRMPRTGYSALRSQIIRAAEAIPTNIVEGAGASTRKEFARFLDISIKSTSELEYQLLLARDYGILPRESSALLTEDAIEVRKMTCVFRKRLLEAAAKETRQRETNPSRSVSSHPNNRELSESSVTGPADPLSS